MLKVECDSCKAPYQIDERRVPPAGLKMRCPKCGQSFQVTNPNAPAPAPAPPPVSPAAASPRIPARPPGAPPPPPGAASPRIPAGASPKKTMLGLSPHEEPAQPSMSSGSLPSDFPAALGFLDEGNLPVVSPDLPAAKASPSRASTFPSRAPVAPPAPKSARAPIGLDLDLPARAADLPTAKGFTAPKAPPVPNAATLGRPPSEGDLPARVADLPVLSSGLPSLPTSSKRGTSSSPFLPSALSSLPTPADALPVPANVLPVAVHGARGGSPASAPMRSFGEIDLPAALDSLPAVTAADRHLPVPLSAPEPVLGGAFGEIDLPREAPPSSGPPRRGAAVDSADFGDVGVSGRGVSSNPPARAISSQSDGGMAFGEVDFGTEGDTAGEASIRVAATSGAPAAGPAWSPAVEAAAIAAVPKAGRWPVAERPQPVRRKRSIGGVLRLLLGVVVLLAGASLQVTPYGAFGYLYISDLLHARDYAAAAATAIRNAQTALGPDTYDTAKAGVEMTYADHARMPRATALAAYAAVVDAATTVRHGPDASRASRAKQLVAELPPGGKVSYAAVAAAAQSAEAGDLDRARSGLDAESKRYPGDPIQLDIALLRGEVELAAQDGNAALRAFHAAAALSNDARVRFGLARAYDLVGDGDNAKKEIDATLVASPSHPGALTLRARRKSAAVDPLPALADLAIVLDGPARAKSSPNELSDAYAAKAWVELERGGVSDARESFEQAVKLNPENVGALNGQGRLFLDEGRYAEALARFDTALKSAPASPETIANDAEAKLALERMEDAKQQLTGARERFPKSISILLALGKVEQRLGNGDAAEADLRAAIAVVDPTRPDAVQPYVTMSELLAARGRLSDARATLDEASKKLEPSAALDRAFGEISELQGDYDAAIARYRMAVAKAPKDLSAHFRLAVALRRVRRFDEASAELDRVGAVDKDYPGLLLERGLLFEESGDVEKAIEQFKIALARAPEDPDLQLRVGSAYVVIGRPDDALPMLRKVLDKRPSSAEAHHYIGRALMLKGGTSQVDALHYLQRAVELDPNRAEFHVYLARAANDSMPAQLELARDEIDRALTLDKTNPEAYWQRGVLERMEGAIDDAMKDEKHALDLRPSRYEAHATLAECYEDRNEDTPALAEWSRAIAGDGTTLGPDGAIPHPYWRYRYGKLLLEKGGRGSALIELLAAAGAGEKMELRPAWLAPLEFLLAEALRGAGRKADAVEHYHHFLDIAPATSPDRADAKSALAQLTGHAAP